MIHIVLDSCVLKDLVEERRLARFWWSAFPKLSQAFASTERAYLVAVREEVGGELLKRVAERLSELFRGFLMSFLLQPRLVDYDEVRSRILGEQWGRRALASARKLFGLDPDDLKDERSELESDAFLLVTALYCASSCERVFVVTSDERARNLLASAIDRLRDDPSLVKVLEKVSEP